MFIDFQRPVMQDVRRPAACVDFGMTEAAVQAIPKHTSGLTALEQSPRAAFCADPALIYINAPSAMLQHVFSHAPPEGLAGEADAPPMSLKQVTNANPVSASDESSQIGFDLVH